MEHKHWKISDFSKMLGKHNNTVDGWFRVLEDERKLHYISRINNEKVYDELDLEIAKFIIDKRNNKWSLDGIFDSIANHFSLRPFPPDFEDEKPIQQVVDFEKVRSAIMLEMKSTFDQAAAALMEKQKDSLQKMLPSREQQRLDRLDGIMAERKVTRSLEDQALSIWSTKPVEERFVKVGWFRRVEDINKRDYFIRDYVDKHFEGAMRKEFGIEQEDDM
ncbi:MerR family transcriptional regulator [Pseudogracilibacillus auburnensis]|uniref:MerR family transcriptional regulator n=1 Tax=Pseudogracilibacillus auburnensis TaxID=1494959 RepID=UPI001A96CF87|nr:MerR family transcriptional regulator [Pseudogracilibacillus auburnensis]MBO1005907.1 MerR family transcriptional regulator [Pseudogracilibacillus auburnensis]